MSRIRTCSLVVLLCLISAQESSPSTAAYPVAVSSNGRYLVDRNNVPFLIHGDSPQALIGNLSLEAAAGFFANRQALGFNTVWVNLLCNSYTGCNQDGTTYDGIPPFTAPGDLATPNEAYFQRADAMINLAAQYGILVILDPIETGGWLQALRDNGLIKSFNYGVYLGNRYRNFPNILWMSGNDFQTWRTAADDALAQAVATGIKAADPNHIHTLQLDYLRSSSLDDARWAPLISLNAAYTYYPTYAEVLHAYNQSSTTPVFMVEANYEFEQNASDRGTPAVLRRQEYWTAFSGAAGQLYASHYSWSLCAGWDSNLNTPGAIQFGYLKNLLTARPWFDLAPDQGHTTVTAGYGTFSSDGTISYDDYVTAARTPSGSLAMAYMPTARTVSVDMARLSGPVNAQWFDPASGTYIAISGSALANSGTMQFTPPGANAAGDSDWVLVLEAAAQTAPTSGATAVALTPVLTWDAVPGATSYDLYFGVSPFPPFLVNTTATSYALPALLANTTYYWKVAANTADPLSSPVWSFTTAPSVGGEVLRFVPITPCRLVDTRADQGKTGAFGPPSLAAYTPRDIPILAGGCGIPATAVAYSLNFTVVPKGFLGNLITWPTGIAMPNVSTLNAYDGRVTANAAIVPAGTGGSISVQARDETELIIDINGYFGPPDPTPGYQFHPLTPCRLVDTRADQGKTGAFGAPALEAYTPRSIPVRSGGCGVPSTAVAYSFNFTVVPKTGFLGNLITWPAGIQMPNVSTLNSYNGQVTANAAIVPAGTDGAINVQARDATELIIDINGYFGPPDATPGYDFHPVTPCRVMDTRADQGKTGAFGPPALAAYTPREIPVPSSGCGIPATAAAYTMNFTAVPQGFLGYLNTWPAGIPMPAVSTLNAYDGQVTANAAIVPAGAGGAINVQARDATDIIIDINGYFGP